MNMSRFTIIVSLCLTYFVFALLLNSAGVVILQVIQNFDVSKSAASQLEGFKDLPIALVSFLVASSLPRYGYRKAMITGLLIILIACLVTPSFPTFLMTKILFLCVGVAFALVKVSVYSSIGLLSHDSNSHASLLNIVEGVFMIGVLSGYWWFSSFIDSTNMKSTAWMNIYYSIAALITVNLILLLVTSLDESEAQHGSTNGWVDFLVMLRLMKLPMVCVFAISVFMYVLIEQGIGSWLPTFNKEILKLPLDMSVEATSIYAMSLAVGRLSAGLVLKRMHWYAFLNLCLIGMILLILMVLPLAHNIPDHGIDMNWWNAPTAAYIFPLIGFLMAPIYPAINSVILSAVGRTKQASMSSVIIIFSALGGTTGAMLMGVAFETMEGASAFYLTLLPIVGIMVSLWLLRRLTRSHAIIIYSA